MAEISGTSATAGTPGVAGSHTGGGDGEVGTGRRGVVGQSDTFQGVVGKSRDNAGVVGESDKQHGVFGVTHSTFAGVFGTSDAGGSGVAGDSKAGRGVHGGSETGVGVLAESQRGIGIVGKGGTLAARFEGDVEVTGDIRLPNADVAEEFAVVDGRAVDPGTVMVLDDDGAVAAGTEPYDPRVVGVAAGAGDYRPGIVLDRREDRGRTALALVGKTYCRVDAQYGRVRVGDLLTTSGTAGHAMRVADPRRAFGAVLGKALQPLHEGRSLIPILVVLQ